MPLASNHERGVVVVGGGHAGGQSVAALRELGYPGPITLVGAEPYLPYERPPLSKGVLTGEQTLPVGQLYQEEFYRENEVRLILGNHAESIDTTARLVNTANGERIGYDSLILATGAKPRRLCVAGEELRGVYYLRTACDAHQIRNALRPGMRCCVIGAGFIGLEAAASFRSVGCAVQVIESGDRVLSRVAPPLVGTYVQQLHESNGVRFLFGASVEKIIGQAAVTGVMTTGRAKIAADLVLIGIGAEPNIDLALDAGIACENGILVDEHGRTSIEGVFAVGDAANFWHPQLCRYLRLESWANAQHGPMAIAHNICGQPQLYAPTAWVWTDQYGENLQTLDSGIAPDAYVLRGSPDRTGRGIYFGLKDRRIVNAWMINNGRERRPITKLIEEGVAIEGTKLSDESISLRSLSKPDRSGVFPEAAVSGEV